MIVIQKYATSLREEAITLLADAFVTNPLHVSAFGAGRVDRNRLFFRIGLEHMFTRAAFLALIDGKVCGSVHLNASPLCLPTAESVAALPAARLRPVDE